MLQLCPTVIILILMLNACEVCLEQVRYIGFLLHNIEKNVDDQRVNTLTENFSLQILHEVNYAVFIIKLITIIANV